MKNGLGKIFLKFLHALTMLFLSKFNNKNDMVSAWRNFKNIFPRPFFIIIFRPEMLKIHPYSILSGDNRVEFVMYCVLIWGKFYHFWPKKDSEKQSRKNIFEIPPCAHHFLLNEFTSQKGRVFNQKHRFSNKNDFSPPSFLGQKC